MKNKTGFAALAALMVLMLLAGCQLAVPDDEIAGGEKDTLCGVFITLEYLDAGAGETIELPPNWNGDMNDIVFPETRIYATRHEDENGYINYTFDGVEGFRFFMIQQAGADGSNYSSSVVEGPFVDTKINVGTNDTRLSGTIYYDAHLPRFSLYPNPVYQTSDGEVYMVPGTGTGVESMGEGNSMTMTISETATETVDGVETSSTMEVEIKAESLNTNQKVVLKQMDENDQAISQAEITQDNIPESLSVLPDTAYMVLEEHTVDYEGKAVTKRTLVKPDEAFFNVRFTGDNGIIESHMVTLNNPEDGGTI